jgi:adenosine deaminase
MNTAFVGAAATLDMSPKDVLRIVTNSFVASFITEEQRQKWLADVHRVYEDVMGEKP